MDDEGKRASGRTFLACKREGEEGAKDKWQKRDHLPLCLPRNEIIFHYKRERARRSPPLLLRAHMRTN